MKRRMVALTALVTLALMGALAGCSSGASTSAASAAASTSASASVATESTSVESASAESADAAASAESASAQDASVSGSSVDASAASAAASTGAAASELADGEYTTKVATDSSMFHVNEADKNMGTLTVKDGQMTIYFRLASKRIVNLYAGTAEQAEADSANVIQPIPDTVTYADGAEEEVYGFEVPVPALDEEFDVAILGEKGKWYDHKVTVSTPEEK